MKGEGESGPFTHNIIGANELHNNYDHNNMALKMNYTVIMTTIIWHLCSPKYGPLNELHNNYDHISNMALKKS